MATERPVRGIYEGVSEPTPASTWYAASGAPITDRLLEWPPDVFALTNVVLTRAEAFRYALSVDDWPPRRFGDWAQAVEEAGRRWSAWAEDRTGALPDLVAEEWRVFCQGAEVPLEELALGRDHRLCEALLTLHAIADEACAGLGVALDSSDAEGCVYRARGRELLARTGSLARIDARLLRVLPKVITPPTGRLAFSRYACVQGPGIDARWHKIPARHRGTDLRSEYATLLLLPWPLRVQASDFHPVGPVQRPAKDPYGFFEFAPAEGLDLDLLDRVLVAARQEAGSVDVVLLPESAVAEDEIDDLETLLDGHGVVQLVAGVRQPSAAAGPVPEQLAAYGLQPQTRERRAAAARGAANRGSTSARTSTTAGRWTKTRWSSTTSAPPFTPISAGGKPWTYPARPIQFVEVAELVLTSLVCEDLAHNDDIAQLIRSVGPTIVVNVLLDGPQLTSRWTARYASVLADDPGSAVLTLTSYGMVERSRPAGRDASRVIALEKDPTRGVREIPLEPGAQGVLLTVCMDRATRYSADRRWPVDNSTSCYGVAVHQVRASSTGSGPPQSPPPTTSTTPVLELDELTILTAWAEGVSEAAAYAPERIDLLLAAAGPGATWRAELGLPEPSPRLADAIESLGRVARAAPLPAGASSFDALLTAAKEDQPGERTLDQVVRHALLSMLEERQTRQPTQTIETR